MNCVLKLKTKALQFHVANTSSTSMSWDCWGAGDEYVSVVFTQCTICIVITNTVTWWAQSVAGWAGADTTCAQGQGSPPYNIQTGFLSVAVQQSGGGCHCCCYSCEESCCCAVVLLEENTKAKTGCQIELWWQTLISGPAPTPALSAELCHVSAGAGSADCST